MAAWGLNCANCNQNLTKLAIQDTLESYFFPEKPDFPEGGNEFECPNCGYKPRTSEAIWFICPDDWVQLPVPVCRIAGISSSHNFALSNILTAPKFSATSLISSSFRNRLKETTGMKKRPGVGQRPSSRVKRQEGTQPNSGSTNTIKRGHSGSPLFRPTRLGR